jgi:hypothetical protein
LETKRRRRTGKVEEAEVDPDKRNAAGSETAVGDQCGTLGTSEWHARSDAGRSVAVGRVGEDAASRTETSERDEQERPYPEEDRLLADALADEDGRNLDDPRPHRETGTDTGLDGRVGDADELEHNSVVVVDDRGARHLPSEDGLVRTRPELDKKDCWDGDGQRS